MFHKFHFDGLCSATKKTLLLVVLLSLSTFVVAVPVKAQVNLAVNGNGFKFTLDGVEHSTPWSATVSSGSHTFDVPKFRQAIGSVDYVFIYATFSGAVSADTSTTPYTFSLSGATTITLKTSQVQPARPLILGLFACIGHVINDWGYARNVNAFLSDCEAAGFKEMHFDVMEDVKTGSNTAIMKQICEWAEAHDVLVQICGHVDYTDSNMASKLSSYLNAIGAPKSCLWLFLDQTEYSTFNSGYTQNRQRYLELKQVCSNYGMLLGNWWNGPVFASKMGASQSEGQTWLISQGHVMEAHAQGHRNEDLYLWTIQWVDNSANQGWNSPPAKCIGPTYGVWVVEAYLTGEDIKHIANVAMTTKYADRILITPNDREYCDAHGTDPITDEQIAAFQSLFADYPEWFGAVPPPPEPSQYNLSIHVLNSSGSQPLSEATVKVMQNSLVKTEGETDVNGWFNATVYEGQYNVNVTKTSYQSNATSVSVTKDTIVTIYLTKNPTPPPSPIAKVTGTVTDEQTGNPIFDAHLVLGGYSNITDLNGTYVFTVPLGTYTLTVNKTGYEIKTVSPINATTEGTRTLDVTLTPISTPYARITGTITDKETEDPIVDAQVILDEYQNTTDANGVYVFTVPLGLYNMTISKVGYETRVISDIDATAEGTFTINVALTSMSTPFATIKGTVTDEQTGNPIANAQVACDVYQNTTNQNGVFTLDVPFGLYNITISKEGYFNQSFTLDCPTAGTYQIGTIALWPIPPPQKGTLRVHAYLNQSEITVNVKVTAVGNFTTPFTMDLNPGSYTLNSTYLNQTQTRTVEISEKQITLVEFHFEALPVPEQTPEPIPENEPEPEPTTTPNSNSQTVSARVPEFTSIIIAISLGVGGYLLGRRKFRRKDQT